MEKEINSLLKQNIQLNSSGSINAILDEIIKVTELEEQAMLLQDIKNLLHLFKRITNTNSFQLLLATINTNMCTKFHTDRNNLRMLCTYSGPGTLWLKEDNINRKALDSYKNNQSIVIDKTSIEQAKTGSVIILKGTKYPKEATKAVVHRSPNIGQSGAKRLLLRIDTN